MHVAVSTTATSSSSPSSAVKYFKADLLTLKNNGADDVEQVVISYDSDPACLGLFGKSSGALMNNPTDRIALPCPEYCKGKDNESAVLLSFADARAFVTGS